MSRLIESSLTGKISRMLVEGDMEQETKECAKVESNITDEITRDDRVADFMIDYDPYGFQDNYDGDEVEKRQQLLNDIANDPNGVKSYLRSIVDSKTGTEGQIETAGELLKLYEDYAVGTDVPSEQEIEADEKKLKEDKKKVIEYRIGELRDAIASGVADDEKEAMEREISDLEDKLSSSSLNESGRGRKSILSEGWKGKIKSGSELRKKLYDAGDEPTHEDLIEVLDLIKKCCEEAKTLTDDEYYQNGFQSVIDDIEMIKDDEDLDLDAVNWELDGLYDWADGADLWVALNDEDSEIVNTNECNLTEATKDEYTLVKADSDKISELENGSALTWEGMATDDKNIKAIVDFFKENTKGFKTPVFMYTWTGKEFNDKYGLTGDNAYPDDLSFLSIPLDSWSEMGNLPMIKMQVGARWLDDIVDNNANRERSKNESFHVANIKKLNESDEVKKGNESIDELKNHLEDLKAIINDEGSVDEELLKTKIEEMINLLNGYKEEMNDTLNEDDDIDYYGEGIYGAIENALTDAGFDVTRYTDAGVLTRNIGWEVSKDGGHTQLDCPGSWYDPKYDKNSDEYEGEDFEECDKQLKEHTDPVIYVHDKLQNREPVTEWEKLAVEYNDKFQEMCGYNTERHHIYRYAGFEDEKARDRLNSEDYDKFQDLTIKYNQARIELRKIAEKLDAIEDAKLEESVTVMTPDGSTVYTDGSASVTADDGQTIVVTGDTSVVINSDANLPVEEVPAESEIDVQSDIEDAVNEPTDNENIGDEEVPVENVEDEVIEESNEELEDESAETVEAKSLAVLKNQGNIYMLQIDDKDGKTTYWVVEDFNPETYEGVSSEMYNDKESADKDYFARVGLDIEEPIASEE